MTDQEHNRWRAFLSRWRASCQTAKQNIARTPSVVAVIALFATFFGWNELVRFFKRHRLRFLSPARIAVTAIVGFVCMFVIWLTRDIPQPNELFFPRLKRFTEEYSFLLYVYAFIIPLLIWWIDKLHAMSEEEKLRRIQKQRVRILDGFAPSPATVRLFSNRSIYNSIISTLGRLEEKRGTSMEGGEIRFRVCLLLCSPALDYPNNPQKPWGAEFVNKISQFVNHSNIHIDICHLPIEPMLGFNPMEDFLSVLADVIKDKPENFASTHRMLVQRTTEIANEIKRWATLDEHKARFTIHPPMLNIPFQIVLVLSGDLKEVVVSFAGREILERGDAEPKGFFSSDPYVVETFHQIYLDYVKQGGRLPFIPPLTKSVIEKHNQQVSHQITNYLGVIPNLQVDNGCFSPALANSSKFTSWVITKVLTKDDNRVLDIGSGTGVLALMAQKTLQQLGAATIEIIAVESDKASFNTLQKNCPAASGVTLKNWCLSPRVEGDRQTGGCFVESGNGGNEVARDQIGQFDVIIADLPFVDVKESLARDQRFFDPEHKAHRTLFMAVSKNNWLKDGGKLITAFSSLGGPDDVLRFERLIADNDLQIVQRVDFHESNYLWIVHVIVKKADYDRDRYWWNKLEAQRITATARQN